MGVLGKAKEGIKHHTKGLDEAYEAYSEAHEIRDKKREKIKAPGDEKEVNANILITLQRVLEMFAQAWKQSKELAMEGKIFWAGDKNQKLTRDSVIDMINDECSKNIEMSKEFNKMMGDSWQRGLIGDLAQKGIDKIMDGKLADNDSVIGVRDIISKAVDAAPLPMLAKDGVSQTIKLAHK